MSKEVIRFEDTGETLGGMLEEILVSCPHCMRCAQVILAPVLETQPSWTLFAKRRLICSHCGLSKEWEGTGLAFDTNNSPMREPYFHAPLWFQMPSCGHTLWALNRRHLCFLGEYIQATLRVGAGMANVLPKWMKIAKHREAILSDVAKLKRKR